MAVVIGTDGNDTLLGTLTDADVIIGRGGRDFLSGFGGDDFLEGDGGADTLLGGAGADDFAYASTADSRLSTGRDTIRDFQDGVDDLHLLKVDARDSVTGNQGFTFVGFTGFTAEGQVRTFFQSGGDGNLDTIVELNTSGSSGAEASIVLDGLHFLDKDDFLL